MKDDTSKSRSFGFVNFESPDDAGQAVQELNGKEVDGKALFVGRAQKKTERQSELRSKFEQIKIEQLSKWQGVNLYIKNLDDEVDDDKLRALFTPFGTITSAKVMRDDKNHSKGFGFVCYTNPEEATKAVTEMNGKIVISKPLYVGLAQTKDARRSQLESQFATRNKILTGSRLGPQPPIYGNGAPPMFYQPNQPGFMGYPQQMMPPRGRFPPSGPYQGAPGNYMMMPSTRGGMIKGGRGGPMQGPRRGGIKQPQGMIPPQGYLPPQAQLTPEQAVLAGQLPPLTASYLANLPEEERTRVLGERLYALIDKSQPQAAGKITGMILESAATEEILELIDNSAALQEKIDEALQVLKEASATAPAENGTAATEQKA
jgi:polyadenylate-binding protein